MSQSDVIDLQSLQTMAKVFGSLLYFPLTDSNNQTLIQALSQDVALADSDIQAWCNTVQTELPDSLNQDFFLLFEGGEVMLAPPWGSVYTDKEEVIFGDSTVAYRQFLRQHDIELDTGMREPEDQIGLMLFAVSQLIEQQQDIDAVKPYLPNTYSLGAIATSSWYKNMPGLKAINSLRRWFLNGVRQCKSF
ncbi:putative oxidoreductase component of anaerobic dehydrogenases [Vibrio variabilis]|uniref:Oxidoreductase component of anaerobic dehydrogenases n=1 Tax=Vibrio variabilis TaxID=990271 RepID=A0ABQ0JN01_9VIBR|nr:putative oxidoreductase component of anaerobic dehydrogenases [Vibrio variabilis]